MEDTAEKKKRNKPFWAAKGPEYELRVIIYEVKDWKLPADTTSGLTDLFIRCKPGNQRWRNTDTHLQASTRGSFNWRMKFTVHLPDDIYDDYMLAFEVFDWDVLGDTLLGSAQINLQEFLELGELYAAPLQYFKRIINREVLNARKDERKRQEEATMKERAAEAAAAAAEAAKAAAEEALAMAEDAAAQENSGLLGGGLGLVKGVYGGVGGLTKGVVNGVGTVAGGTLNVTMGAAGAVGNVSAAVGGAVGDATMNVVGGVGAGLQGIGARKKKRKPTLWEEITKSIGFGPLPAHSGWIPIKHGITNDNGHTHFKTVGQLLVGVELLPKAVARKMNAGEARNMPNEHPTLPPPEGRPDPTAMLNPLAILKDCIMDGLVKKFIGVILILLFLYVFFFTFPALFGVVQLVADLPGGGWILLGLIVFGTCCTCMALRQCMDGCGCNRKDDDEEEHGIALI